MSPDPDPDQGPSRTEADQGVNAAGEPTRVARILVVDDEPLMGAAIARLLAEHKVTALTSARVAVDRILANDDFDVILCDLVMPDFSGMDLYEGIARQKPELLGRIVFVTGGAYTAEAIAFLDRIGNPQLEKPLRPDDLRGAVTAMLKNKFA